MSSLTRSPALVERTPASLDGQPTTRLIFIFRAVGCAYARRPDGGCTNCGFAPLTTRGQPVSEEDLIAQFDSILIHDETLQGIGEVDLYNSGSFLCDQEIPPAVRSHVLSRLAKTRVQRVLIEARPEHVSAEKLQSARVLLPGRQLELGMGLESSNNHTREALVNKGFSLADYEKAVGILGRTGCRLLSYVLVKPLGLSEEQAIQDSIQTIQYVFGIGKKYRTPTRVALEPTFVAPETKLEQEFLAGRYLPPNLWSVVRILQHVHGLGDIIVGLSDEGLEPKRSPASCPLCTTTIQNALRLYNATQDVKALDSLHCSCQP